MSMSGRKARWGGAIVGGVLVIAAIASIFLIDWQRDQAGPEPLVRPLKTIVVAEPGPEVRTHPARIRARKEVTLAFEVAGVVRELYVRRGERVEQGEERESSDAKQSLFGLKTTPQHRDNDVFRRSAVEITLATDDVCEVVRASTSRTKRTVQRVPFLTQIAMSGKSVNTPSTPSDNNRSVSAGSSPSV